jgi:hypothetical protein
MHTDQCREPVGEITLIACIAKSFTECVLQAVPLKAVSAHISKILHLYTLAILQLRKTVDEFSPTRQRFGVGPKKTLLVEIEGDCSGAVREKVRVPNGKLQGASFALGAKLKIFGAEQQHLEPNSDETCKTTPHLSATTEKQQTWIIRKSWPIVPNAHLL